MHAGQQPLRSYSIPNSSEALDTLHAIKHKPEVNRFLEAAQPIQTLTDDIHPYLDDIASGKTIALDYMLMTKSSMRCFSA